jgi:hypothetical protein
MTRDDKRRRGWAGARDVEPPHRVAAAAPPEGLRARNEYTLQQAAER